MLGQRVQVRAVIGGSGGNRSFENGRRGSGDRRDDTRWSPGAGLEGTENPDFRPNNLSGREYLDDRRLGSRDILAFDPDTRGPVPRNPLAASILNCHQHRLDATCFRGQKSPR